MERFGSFNVDHNKLEPGIYLSRKDKLGTGYAYTVDIRVCKPYVDKTLATMVMHSVEHLVASRMESLCTGPIKKVYFGPMGCCTGFYAVFYVPCDLANAEVEKALLIKLKAMFSSDFDIIPFNSTTECGDCRTLAVTDEELKKVCECLTKVRRSVATCISLGKFNDYPYIED